MIVSRKLELFFFPQTDQDREKSQYKQFIFSKTDGYIMTCVTECKDLDGCEK